LRPKNYKPKQDYKQLKIKKTSSGKMQRHSLSNRTPDERISFSMNHGEDSEIEPLEETIGQKDTDEDHILVQEINNMSNNFYDSNAPDMNHMDLVNLPIPVKNLTLAI
jgi:hypothetical protein